MDMGWTVNAQLNDLRVRLRGHAEYSSGCGRLPHIVIDAVIFFFTRLSEAYHGLGGNPGPNTNTLTLARF